MANQDENLAQPNLHAVVVLDELTPEDAHKLAEVMSQAFRENDPFMALTTGFKVWDFAWRSGRDASWDEFVELSGGVEAIKDRCRENEVGFDGQKIKMYGKPGEETVYSTNAFAVHPNSQGKGVGTAVQKFCAELAQAAGTQLIFVTNAYNLPFYEKNGCKRVGDWWTVEKARFDGYPAGSHRFTLVETFTAA